MEAGTTGIAPTPTSTAGNLASGNEHKVDVGLNFHIESKAGTSCGRFNVERSPVKLPSARHMFNASEELSTAEKPTLALVEESGFEKDFSIKKLRTKTSSPLKFRNKRASPLDNTKAGKKIEILSRSKQDLINLQMKSLEKHVF